MHPIPFYDGLRMIVKKTLFLLVAVGLAAALNAGAQISTSGSGAIPAPAPALGTGNYAPGYAPYTPAALPSPDIGNPPAAQTHVPESATLIYGSIMLVPLAVSLVRVLRRRHVLP